MPTEIAARRLLVAIDESDPGRDALELARVLCAGTGASALVVNVLYGGPLPLELALLPEEEAKEAEPLLSIARTILAGVEVETQVYGGGSPGALITALSEEEGIDAVVLGSPHRSGIDRMFSGSVAISVLNGSKADVFVAPPGYAGSVHDGLATVAVAYVGTAESKLAVSRALELVDPAGRVEILTVAEPPVPLSSGGRDLPNPTDPDRVLAEGRGLVPAGVEVEARRLDGAAAPELEKACAAGVDLLVLGSRGYGPVMRVPLGSVSGHVFRHAPCPLSIARRP